MLRKFGSKAALVLLIAAGCALSSARPSEAWVRFGFGFDLVAPRPLIHAGVVLAPRVYASGFWPGYWPRREWARVTVAPRPHGLWVPAHYEHRYGRPFYVRGFWRG